uniref:Transposase n=1 Tax=Mesocestoides corti TaxID=53468 RepID=A0A5K3G2C6_MESCO
MAIERLLVNPPVARLEETTAPRGSFGSGESLSPWLNSAMMLRLNA